MITTRENISSNPEWHLIKDNIEIMSELFLSNNRRSIAKRFDNASDLPLRKKVKTMNVNEILQTLEEKGLSTDGTILDLETRLAEALATS